MSHDGGVLPAAGPPRIGTAGWTIRRPNGAAFAAEGSALARYAGVFTAVEINSSFYRPHRPATYARWAASVPDDFSFALKVPKAVTHEKRLVGTDDLLDRFALEAGALGAKLGVLLVQLPPSLPFDAAVAEAFFAALRGRFVHGAIACEPRHASWFAPAAEAVLAAAQVARVAADPARVPVANVPGGWSGLRYRRLHGSPVIYRSAYTPEFIQAVGNELRAAAASGAAAWCIFDNTALGAAMGDALALRALLGAATFR